MMIRRYKAASQIDSVIDLEKLKSGPPKCIERDPSQFFALTYVTEDLQKMLRALGQRFGSALSQTEGTTGLILAEGIKGQGKSHALGLGHHLFVNPDQAREWMATLDHSWNPPSDVIVVVEKFTDQYLPFDSLWSYLAEKLGVSWSHDHPPSLREFRDALIGRHLVLIFDELERGITNIVDPSRRSQNLTFLQMISEEANRDRQVILIAAIYDGAVEPGTTLKRLPRIELRFRKPEDRASIVRHRLFTNAQTYDRKAADDLIRSYSNAWQRIGVQISNEYVERLRSSFPFLPELIDLIFERMGGGEVFQGTRGALGLLGAMLDARNGSSGLLTGAQCKLTDQACADRLQDLDPSGATIGCAAGNLRDLKVFPYAEAIASATLLASLVPTGRARGLSKDELIRHVVEPGHDPNQFESTLDRFRRYGSYFHVEEGRYYFDIHENEEAKVELEALRSGSDELARERVRTLWLQDLFKDSLQTVVYTDLDATQAALNALPRAKPRFVLAPRRLSSPERHAVYKGAEIRNQIILLEPKDNRASHMTNPDVLAAANRYAAAAALAPTAKTAERRAQYEKIANRERKSILDAIRDAGLVYVRVERWGEISEESVFELEPLGQASNWQDVPDSIRTRIFPQPFFIEHIRERLTSFLGQRVEQIDRIYRTTLGYPVPLKDNMVAGAILSLVEASDNCVLGLYGPRGRNFCGKRVDLSAGEVDEAVLAPPWPDTAPPPNPQSQPSGQPEPEPRSRYSSDSSPGASQPSPPADQPEARTRTEPRGTPMCRSLGELRQQVAQCLNNLEGADVVRASFRIFANAQDVELSGFSSALRGALSGKGNLDIQIDLSCPGPMTKAQVENKCEQLPQIAQASYSASLLITIKDEES